MSYQENFNICIALFPARQLPGIITEVHYRNVIIEYHPYNKDDILNFSNKSIITIWTSLNSAFITLSNSKWHINILRKLLSLNATRQSNFAFFSRNKQFNTLNICKARPTCSANSISNHPSLSPTFSIYGSEVVIILITI